MLTPIPNHERNWGARLVEWTYRGLRCVTLENEVLRVSILVDKGTDIFEFLHKPSDTEFMWRSPTGIRNPATFVPTSVRAEGSFLDYYEGGWQECFPTGGTPATVYGTNVGQHGEVCLIPWNYIVIEDHPDRVQVKFWVRTYRTPFLLEKTLELGRNSGALSFEEHVTNEGQEPMDFVWGHHPAIGAPFLDESCRITLPGGSVQVLDSGAPSRCRVGRGYAWPIVPGQNDELVDLSKFPPHETRASDLVIVTDMPGGWYALTSEKRGVGFGMVWPLDVFNSLWYWQEFHGGRQYPWYGRNYNIALEPWTCPQMNIAEARKAGTQRELAPGESLSVRFKAIAYSGIARVNHIEPSGEVIAE